MEALCRMVELYRPMVGAARRRREVVGATPSIRVGGMSATTWAPRRAGRFQKWLRRQRSVALEGDMCEMPAIGDGKESAVDKALPAGRGFGTAPNSAPVKATEAVFGYEDTITPSGGAPVVGRIEEGVDGNGLPTGEGEGETVLPPAEEEERVPTVPSGGGGRAVSQGEAGSQVPLPSAEGAPQTEGASEVPEEIPPALAPVDEAPIGVAGRKKARRVEVARRIADMKKAVGMRLGVEPWDGGTPCFRLMRITAEWRHRRGGS